MRGRRQRDDIPSSPYVDTRGPFSGVLDILCGERAPTPDLHGDGVPRRYWATHLSFTFAELPDGPKDGTTNDGGWTRIVRTIGGARITVLSDEAHLAEARRIAESAAIVEVDANGCEVTSEIQAKRYLRPEPAFDVRRLDSVDSIAVCQYARGAGTDKSWKLASRVISGDAAQNLLLEAIKDAPAGGGPDTPGTCVHDYVDGTAIVLRLREGDRVHDVYVYYESCINNGFDDGTTRRALTLASCEPLWGARVVHSSGSSAPFRACHGVRPAPGSNRRQGSGHGNETSSTPSRCAPRSRTPATPTTASPKSWVRRRTRRCRATRRCPDSAGPEVAARARP